MSTTSLIPLPLSCGTHLDKDLQHIFKKRVFLFLEGVKLSQRGKKKRDTTDKKKLKVIRTEDREGRGEGISNTYCSGRPERLKYAAH